MKDIKQIYRDHTGGWREKNPYSKNDVIYVPTRNASRYACFELDIQYHEFPNCPDTKEGEVVMAYLQWQYNRNNGTPKGEWTNIIADLNYYRDIPTRQIWVGQ